MEIKNTYPDYLSARERQERLESAVDRLRGKYGMGAVRFGASAPGKKEDSLL